MIKIDVISGFLGAGKTTLIRKLLKAYENEKVVLIENEFGEIGIDGDLVERDGFEVFEISSGCICCIMKKDFEMVLNRVIKEFNPERIIIEPTGISILSEIIDILRSEEISRSCHINSLLTVIDSENYMKQCDAFGEFFEDQIINAEALILSKSQFVEEDKLQEVKRSLRELNENAEIISSDWNSFSSGEVKELLVQNLNLDFKDLFYTEYKPCSENEFKAIGIETSRKFTKEELGNLLSKLKDSTFGEVLRGKGFLKGEKGYLDFSYTNGQYIINENSTKSSGKACIIGKNLNEEEIKNLFKAKGGGIFNWLKF
ncbi:GTP-binding protein [Clostridium sp.]|uniref:CobW family GTP-binding protein n=1 Tax=Clostridium sp. TaxID=1506 RepID=UPI002FCB1611